MEGRRQRVVGNGLVRAPPLRWTKHGASKRLNIEQQANICRLLDSSEEAARRRDPTPPSFTSLPGDDSLSTGRPDPDLYDGGDDKMNPHHLIRFGRRRQQTTNCGDPDRNRRCRDRMVNVSLPFAFGVGCGTGGGASLGHVTLRLWKVDIGDVTADHSSSAAVGYDDRDPSAHSHGRHHHHHYHHHHHHHHHHQQQQQHHDPSKSCKYHLYRPLRRRLRRRGEERARFREGLCHVGLSTMSCGVLNAACVLLSTKVFFPRLGRSLWSWLTGAGIGQWALRFLGKDIGLPFRSFQDSPESEVEKRETIWGGVSWPQRVEEFSIASIVLSLAVPFLQWRFPRVHHALKCGGAAIPVMTGYARTSNLVRGQPVGAAGEGEKFWRERHRWAAERLCHLMTDFSEKPALGWVVSLAQATSVVVEPVDADVISAGDGGAGVASARVTACARRVWGSISLPSLKPFGSGSGDGGSLPQESEHQMQTEGDDTQEIARPGNRADSINVRIERARSSPPRQILPTMAARLMNLLLLSAAAAVLPPPVCMRNGRSLLPFVPLQRIDPQSLESKERSLSSNLSMVGHDEEPAPSQLRISLPLLSSQIIWLSSLWALSFLQAGRASSSSPSSSAPMRSSLSLPLRPPRTSTPLPLSSSSSSSSSSSLPLPPPSSSLLSSSLALERPSRNSGLRVHELQSPTTTSVGDRSDGSPLLHHGTRRGFRLTIDFGGGRVWCLTVPDWVAGVRMRRRTYLSTSALKRAFRSVEEFFTASRWRRRAVDTLTPDRDVEEGMSIVQAAHEGFDYFLQIYFLFLRAIWLILVFSPLFTLLPVLYFASCCVDERRGRDLMGAIWVLLRFCLERGGAAFIKWAQWSATRQDLFPEEFCACLSRLHDRAPTHSLSQTRNEIRRHLGREVEDLFDDFSDRPIASGSIAQVRHPNVALRIHQDFQIMKGLASVLHPLPIFRGLNLQQSLQQFSHTMTAQADLRVEARNLERFYDNFLGLHQSVISPRLIPDLIAAVGVDTFLKMMLVDNFVHLDLHPGNILARVAEPEPQNCQSPAELAKDMKELFDRECQLKKGPIDLNEVLKQVLCLARKHDVTINSSYASLVVSVCILSGFAHSLDPDLSIMDAVVPCLFAYNLTGLVLGRIYG
ncbi:hypothetical protein CBR_g49633 [Chara braunii]|uniref:ABC1 atypical kinase-like domain-containing protein n=1 Tax=Chara braunii TaxID=69332 RepID=A0A388M5N4_CHABU|nr:hypothetical protein CBR_g49633 [Chara braunii]|eukprot:GBG89782.1 hypothetical protein CBR_g49633 [Chara braunii]